MLTLYALLAAITVLLVLILVMVPSGTPPEPDLPHERTAAGEPRPAPLERRPQQPPAEERAPQDLDRAPALSALRRLEDPVRLYFVLDDAGETLAEIEPFLRLEFPFTVAVLPHLAQSHEVATAAAAAGKEVILHQPMEAENAADPGPGAIELGQGSAEIRAILHRNLASLPPVAGVNNHMGSRATRDEAVMQTVFEALHERGLFFLDSRTTHETVAPRVAAEVGVPIMERDVFLDHIPEREAIETALQHALRLAESRGHAVMIGHVMVRELAEVFEEVYPELRARGYRFETLSRYFTHERDNDDPRD